MAQAGGRRLVLRKKPPGKLLASAHAVEREHRVQTALAGTPVPVPRMLCLCADGAVLGTPFYVMEHVQVNETLPCLPRVKSRRNCSDCSAHTSHAGPVWGFR